MMPNKVLIFLLVLLGCGPGKKNSIHGIFYTETANSYQEYTEQGYSSIPYNILILEKKCDDHRKQLEFDDDGKHLVSSKWIFDLDTSISVVKNIQVVVETQELNRISPIITQDSTYYYFNALTKTNMLIMGRVLDDSYSNYIELSYFHPD